VTRHLNTLNVQIYPILQSAYRAACHSTETALLKVHNDIMCSMDQQRVSLLVLLDLSAAFDTVDHQVLLHRLDVSFRITGTALKWFKSYLTNRSQRVLINGNYSQSFSLPHGVPHALVSVRCFSQSTQASYSK
jgi:hypothetical protein